MIEGLVSVIIPSYNRAHILPRSVDSVLSQTYPDIEIIIIDDGSKDNTREVVQAKYGNNSKVIYIYKENGGVSSARNLGLKKVRGEFIALLDSDDIWFAEKIESQVACLNKCPEVGMIWTDFSAFDSKGNKLHARFLRIMYETYRFFPTPMSLFSKQYNLKELTQKKFHEIPCEIPFYTGNIFSPMVLGSLVHTSTVVFRQNLLESIGFFDETFKVGEDYKFHLKTTSLTNVGFIDYPLIDYLVMGEDALTAHKYHLQIAENYLKTLMESLQVHGDRIELSSEMIRTCLADAYVWVGQERALLNHQSKALSFFMKSFFIKPFQTMAYKNIVKLVLNKIGFKFSF